jgi:hypothetical protein
MRKPILALVVALLLLTSATARADGSQLELRRGRALVAVGTILVLGSFAAMIACALTIAGEAGDGLGEHYYYASHPDAERDVHLAQTTSCALHAALPALAIPLTVAGAKKMGRAKATLRLSVNGLSGTF